MFFGVIPLDLFLDEIAHGLFALPFATFLWLKTKKAKYFFLVLLVTYIIDFDHWVDYFLANGTYINLKTFFKMDYFSQNGRVFVIFHAWEYAFILLFLAYKKGWESIFALLAMALLPHLVYDSITLNSIIFYSITYRALNGFVLL